MLAPPVENPSQLIGGDHIVVVEIANVPETIQKAFDVLVALVTLELQVNQRLWFVLLELHEDLRGFEFRLGDGVHLDCLVGGHHDGSGEEGNRENSHFVGEIIDYSNKKLTGF